MRQYLLCFFSVIILYAATPASSFADESLDKVLFDAIKAGDHPAFTAALEHGANANALSEKGAPALAAATLAKQHNMAVSLLEAGAKPDAQYMGYIGATALMLSVHTQNLSLAEQLLEAGADVDFRDSNGDPAINWAAYYGYADFVSLFLKHGASTSLTGHGNAREIAMRRGHQSLILLLARHDKVNLPTPDEAMLIDAVQAGDLGGVQEALTIGVPASSADFTGRPVLAMAARLGHADIVSALVNKGSFVDEVDSIGFTALMEAVRDGQIKTARLLLDAGARPGHRSKPSALSLGVIHMAALSGSAEMVSLVAKTGVDLDMQGREGGTALLWCLREEKYSTATRLLELGANPYIKSKAGTSAADMINAYGAEKLKALMKAESAYKPTQGSAAP